MFSGSTLIDSREVHKANTSPLGIDVIVAGIETEVISVQYINASIAIDVTVYVFSLSETSAGITISPLRE